MGTFFGTNLFWDMERPIFLPRSIILERLGAFSYILEKECISKSGEASQVCKYISSLFIYVVAASNVYT